MCVRPGEVGIAAPTWRTTNRSRELHQGATIAILERTSQLVEAATAQIPADNPSDQATTLQEPKDSIPSKVSIAF